MRLWRGLKQLGRYPSAVAGLTIIAGLIVLSVYALVSIPYAEAVRLWRGGEGVWTETPRNAMPTWFNLFPGNNYPETINLNSATDPDLKQSEDLGRGVTESTITFAFDYDYDGFPQELSVFLAADSPRRPYVTLTWLTPDGREVALGDLSIRPRETLRLSQDAQLQRRLGGRPEVRLFADPDAPRATPLHGRYALRVEGLLFDEGATLDAQMVMYGQVYGWAGTDHRRRDISVALLWGTPIALAFGLLVAVGSTVTTLIIAAVGVWYGGVVDAVIQRITEVNLILPVLAILIMIGTFYSRSIWVMLGALIALGIFSGGIKTYRAMFLQIKESPYIEAARAYGAGPLRIIFRYMIPKVVPLLVPSFVTLIPSIVFTEATLAILGLGDPVLPTWGKVLNDAYSNGALYNGYYYWVLEPSAFLVLTGVAFAMVGFALDRVFNPRLREV